ncbi:hypothetical protein ABPG72_000722 [Tetrahymena utriculariae]
MNRNLKLTQIFGQFYVLFVLSFIIFMYYDIYRVFQPNLFEWQHHTFSNLYFIIFNLLFIMLFWCLIRTMISDPGKIPTFWGFYFDDPEHKKRRYCLICHIFKPERCHHCSICGRCVLNMDHHCPWLNNCIGFQNRKFFFLLIFYVNVAVWYILGGFLPFVWKILSNLRDFKAENLWVLIPFSIFIPFSIIIFNFFLFHYRLIARNMTTLENLDRERNKEPLNAPSKYDLGFKYNWEQVFGKNQYLWPFPIFGESGKPAGDGVTYRHCNEVQEQNVEMKEKSDVSKKTNDQFEEDNDHDLQMQKNFIPPQYKQNQRLSTNQQQVTQGDEQRGYNVQFNNSQGISNLKFNQTNQSVMNSTLGRNNLINVNQSYNQTQNSTQFNKGNLDTSHNQQLNQSSNQNTSRNINNPATQIFNGVVQFNNPNLLQNQQQRASFVGQA